MTLKKLGKYNFGTKDNPCKISTLKEMLRILPNDKIVLIEIKCHSEEDRFIDCFYDTIKNFLDKHLPQVKDDYNEPIITITGKQNIQDKIIKSIR